MATAYLRAESAPAYPMNLPPRAAIEAAVETLLSVLDTLDGDPDAEDATGLEDDFTVHASDGPGCPIADAGEEDDDSKDPSDEGEPEQAVEWAFADADAYGDQVRRIRRTRCFPRTRLHRVLERSGFIRERHVEAGFLLLNEPKVPSKRTLLRARRGMLKRPRA